MYLKPKLIQVQNKNKEKQTCGGDHIFQDDPSSKGDSGAGTFFPLTAAPFQGSRPMEEHIRT